MSKRTVTECNRQEGERRSHKVSQGRRSVEEIHKGRERERGWRKTGQICGGPRRGDNVEDNVLVCASVRVNVTQVGTKV